MIWLLHEICVTLITLKCLLKERKIKFLSIERSTQIYCNNTNFCRMNYKILICIWMASYSKVDNFNRIIYFDKTMKRVRNPFLVSTWILYIFQLSTVLMFVVRDTRLLIPNCVLMQPQIHTKQLSSSILIAFVVIFHIFSPVQYVFLVCRYMCGHSSTYGLQGTHKQM